MRKLALLCFACALALALPVARRDPLGEPMVPHGPPPSGRRRSASAACPARDAGGSTSPRSRSSVSSRRAGRDRRRVDRRRTRSRMRAAGAKTVYWDMYLNRRVGQPSAPADPDVDRDAREQPVRLRGDPDRLREAVIALNELFGAHLETPWTASNQRYRENVLAFVRTLAARGARPFLLISTRPYTGSDEAADWWREVAKVADLVPEVYFGGPVAVRARGRSSASRRIRVAMRRPPLALPRDRDPRRRGSASCSASRPGAAPAGARACSRTRPGTRWSSGRRSRRGRSSPSTGSPRSGPGAGRPTTATPTTRTSRARCASTSGRASPALCDGLAARRAGLRRRRGRTGRSGCRRRGSAGSSAAAASTRARSPPCSR